ncbi:SDR family NAD(P)-dependent oxidoreductase [Hymenobacter sp. UV11]|uniref:oxidoreductase n=1 Tax=Hymenobacter sp. UV11 TaxID=1849735 RepID=UPI00105F521F|nr:oxidoreductase [Hymenobacter sp. UV11]TDN37379.1 short-chain dehydrogenase/reductase [Hymenobacter sp. UV11]TFZ68565.1 SDR family NAD(P)-dependent oxidoreductase [Hymenobacter sp. UV11]
MPDTQKTWFITGASTGLGEALASVLLDKGERVVGTFRKSEQVEEFTKRKSGHSLGVLVDVTDEAQIQGAVAHAIVAFGYLDVVVNNAGYGSLGSIEEITEEETIRQFSVNMMGPLRVVRAVLPHLRERKAGHILNITSVGGFIGMAHAGIYNGSKFALEGLGESLAAQLAPLGIHVTNVEPGPFRTKWAGESATYTEVKIADYDATVGAGLTASLGRDGNQAGDPVKAAEALYQLVRLPQPPVHLLLGGFAYKLVREKLQNLLKEIDDFAYLGEPTDF